MPPKIRYEKAKIIDAGIAIVRESGWEAVNAREIARMLGCSTQPIFRVFVDMKELKQALWTKAWMIYAEFLEKCRQELQQNEKRTGLAFGIAYIKFAQIEKNLYKLLFTSDSIDFKDLHGLIHNINNDNKIIEIFMKLSGFEREDAYTLHFKVWMFMHGLATMLANNVCAITDDEIATLISENTMANIEFMKKKEKE